MESMTKEKIIQIIRCEANDYEHKRLIMFDLKKIVSKHLCKKHKGNNTLLSYLLLDSYIEDLTERYFRIILRSTTEDIITQ
jgi:hypothetical protein